MASRTAFLAVALSLTVLLLVFVVVCILLLLFTRNIRQKYNKDLLQLNEALDEAKSTLAIYPWAKKRGIAGDNLPMRRTVQESFGTFAFLLGSYAVSWMNDKGSSSFASPAHIESILFPKPAQTNGQDDDGSSPFIFPNPHRYTPSEIQSLLQHDGTRSSIFQHIVSSVILQNVSVNGPPGQTILPLLPEELQDLKRMLELIRGHPLGVSMVVHISDFASCYPKPKQQMDFVRKTVGELFESLFQPYFASDLNTIQQRRNEFDTIVEKAIDFGMQVLGHPHETFQCRWGERKSDRIMVSPTLSVTRWNGDGTSQEEDICEPVECAILTGGTGT